MMDCNWFNLPVDLLEVIVQKLSLMEDSDFNIINCSVVCKSWRSVILNSTEKPFLLRLIEKEKSWLPPKHPMLLLAEPTANMPFKWDVDDEEEDWDQGSDNHEDDEEEDNDDGVEATDGEGNEDDDNNVEYEEEEDNDDDVYDVEEDGYDNVEDNYNPENYSIGSMRGLFSVSTRKTHVFSLPEAAGRLIAGTNIGWLVTLGRDFKINLLHPLLRRQIPLPDMHAFTTHQKYTAHYRPETASEFFFHKVVLSSRISTLPNLLVDVSPPPTIMTIYGACYKLGFARLGDKSWTDVKFRWGNFYDIIYHKERFYGVDCRGDVYRCDIDNDNRGATATKIASLSDPHHHDENHKYLVESLCGSYLYLVVRVRTCREGVPAYLTTKFSVWKFQIPCNNSTIRLSKREKVRSLGNNALFVGRMASLCVQATGCIKRNCIYFTDDYFEGYYSEGRGGYDMGIYNLKTGTIKPHFSGLSIHPTSPPLWYI